VIQENYHNFIFAITLKTYLRTGGKCASVIFYANSWSEERKNDENWNITDYVTRKNFGTGF